MSEDASADRPARGARRIARLAVTVLVPLLSACQLRQEIRFDANGSGTASISVGVDKECLTGPMECSAQAKGLLGGDGPVAQAEAEAAMLPFDVRVEPFESGPPDSPTETGYTLSFDFASLEDLEEKLVSTGRSRTSAFEFSAMMFEANGDGGFHVHVPNPSLRSPWSGERDHVVGRRAPRRGRPQRRCHGARRGRHAVQMDVRG